MVTEREYNRLISISRNKYPDCYEDIVHDAILLGFDFEGCIQRLKGLSYNYFTVKEVDLTDKYEEKVCIKCNKSLPIAYFPVYRLKNLTSTKNVCTDCKSIQDAEYREQHKDEYRLYKREWNRNNKDRVAVYSENYWKNFKEVKQEYNKQWWKDNPEKAKEYRTKYRENNREKYLESLKSWRNKNPEKVKEYRNKYYAKKKLEKQLSLLNL